MPHPPPAERFAAAQRAARYPHLRAFRDRLDLELDDFQVAGCESIESGRGVLVAAPTGAGKTIVGEFAVELALAQGAKAFYTTPIKALSNQKYVDLVARHGADKVGLLTGDASVNGEAPVVVMTTEVLRNMLYAGSPTLTGLKFVVMDEVHYLADRFRGPVWEEVIIHLPQDVAVVSLSATVSNAEEFGDWLSIVRGGSDVVVSEHRPVPLWQHMMVGRRLHDLFVDDSGVIASRSRGRTRVNPSLLEAIRRIERQDGPYARRGHAPRRGGSRGRPSRVEVIERLDDDGLLPAITFIFSRVGCEAAVGQLLAAGIHLIDEAEGRQIRRIVEERVSVLDEDDLAILGYWDFVDGLSRGFAAHHAGMLPTFREIVEELFTAGRIRAVFATETLALGINMPARSVVIERLVKFNGETHADITPAEYTQLTGRAGRRGIDVEGHAVVVWSPGLDPDAVAGLASTRTYPLRSSFRPTSNMTVNLVSRMSRDDARALLETSFAQFQADRAVVGLSRSARKQVDHAEGYREQMACHLGDFTEYATLRERIRAIEKDGARSRAGLMRTAAASSLSRLRPGDVISVPSGRRAGLAVVVAARPDKSGASLPTVVTQERQLRRLTIADITAPVEPFATVRIPKGFNAKSAKSRRDLASTLRTVAHRARPSEEASFARSADDEAQLAHLRAEMRTHPCHQCPHREEHARWAERWARAQREADGLQRQVAARTNSVAKAFDRLCDLLGDLGYLTPDGRQVTTAGHLLQRLYTEKDLLAAECLRSGDWRRLDPAALAAVVSCLLTTSHGDDAGLAARMPTSEVTEAFDAMVERWTLLTERERQWVVPVTAPPDPGMAWAIHRWCSGQSLNAVLKGADLAAGDFVRRCKQVVDLLGQIGDSNGVDPQVAATARKAAASVMRGVVAADRVD